MFLWGQKRGKKKNSKGFVMNVFENLNTCCYKALKHGDTVCPVCETALFETKQKIVADMVKRQAESKNK